MSIEHYTQAEESNGGNKRTSVSALFGRLQPSDETKVKIKTRVASTRTKSNVFSYIFISIRCFSIP